jgi:predicted amidohydrolase YtcJ
MSQIVSPREASKIARLADRIIRAGAIYSMAANRKVYRAIALRDEWIVAVSEDPHGLDGLITSGTLVVDDPRLTLIPAFFDTHNHFIIAARNMGKVPADQAHSIAELVELIRQQAAHTPPGQWVQTVDAWHESNLTEGRLPTAPELDQATREHPVWVKRGGHIGVANSLALKLANITRDTPDPKGATIKRFPDGTPNGILLEAAAWQLVLQLIPPLPTEQLAENLRQACMAYNSLGIGAVRDPIVSRDEFLAYQLLRERGELTVRCQVMFLMPRGLVASIIADIAENPGIKPGTLVIEHGMLAYAEQRARAIKLEIPITVEQSVLYALGAEFLARWGEERLRQIVPIRAWLEEGAHISAATDYPAGLYDPMLNIWGMVTRRTKKAGIQGPEYAVDQYTAVQLSTAAGAHLIGESDRRGTLQAGRLADLVAFRTDPITCPVDQLLGLRPIFTIVGGREVYDPESMLSEQG